MYSVISYFGDNIDKCCAESSVTVHWLLSCMVFTHVTIPTFPFWYIFPRALLGKRYVVILCGGCFILGSIMGEIVDFYGAH